MRDLQTIDFALTFASARRNHSLQPGVTPAFQICFTDFPVSSLSKKRSTKRKEIIRRPILGVFNSFDERYHSLRAEKKARKDYERKFMPSRTNETVKNQGNEHRDRESDYASGRFR
jgi:hypothetical protein